MTKTAFPPKILWIDTETTGLDPTLHDPWQIAGFLEVGGVEVAEWSSKMSPVNSDHVDEQALKITGIARDDLLALPCPVRTKTSFEIWLTPWCQKFNRDDKIVLAGYNARFDYDMLRAWWEKTGDKYFGSYFFWPVLDVSSLCALWLSRGHRTPSGKATLGAFCEAFGIALKAHDAMHDIRATRTLYNKLMEALR